MTVMHHQDVQKIDAGTLHGWVDQNKAVLIDIRDPMEYAREHIDGARLVPLDDVENTDFSDESGRIAVFHCSSGNRTAMAEDKIKCTPFKEVYQLEGGMEAWKQAGYPVIEDRSAPIPLMRQVQITAGTLVLLGVIMSLYVHPSFIWLSGFVGGGLVFAGVSGHCGLMRVISMMPWNRITTAGTTPHDTGSTHTGAAAAE